MNRPLFRDGVDRFDAVVWGEESRRREYQPGEQVLQMLCISRSKGNSGRECIGPGREESLSGGIYAFMYV